MGRSSRAVELLGEDDLVSSYRELEDQMGGVHPPIGARGSTQRREWSQTHRSRRPLRSCSLLHWLLLTTPSDPNAGHKEA